jgi:tetratricopeptide (TPR) repeat protein
MKLQNLYFSFLKTAGIMSALALVLCFSAADASAQPGSGRITPTTGASKKKTTTTTVKKTTTTVTKKAVTATRNVKRKVTSTAKNYDYYYNLGLSFYDKGDYPNAIANYTQAIKLNPRSADAYYNRALVYYDSENYSAAIRDYTQSIQINPAADAYNNRGLSYEKNGNRAQAVSDYRTALRLKPDYALAQENLDRLDNVADDDGGSAGSAGNAGSGGGGNTNSTNKDADSYAELADAYYDKRDFDNALVNYTKAINLAPREAGSYVRRGFIYHYTGEVVKAYDDYNNAVRLDPSLKSEPYIQCMLYDVTADNANTGVNICTKTITEFPGFSLAYYKRGVAYRALKNYDLSLRDFTKSIELYPSFFNSHIYRGLIYVEQNKLSAAMTEYNKAIQVGGANNPNVYLAYNNRGVVYETQNNYTAAAADYRKAYQLKPSFTTAKENLDAVLQKQKGNY